MQRAEGRVLAAVLFTDMVSSTAIAEELGDRRWKALVHAHHRIVRRAIKRFGGTEHDTAGDGFFASFKEPASAISCACSVTEGVRELGVEIRAGIHFGECERIGDKLGGIAVVVGARIMALATAGEVLVSSTAAELSRGAGFGFEDRGMQRLKGVEDAWRVFATTTVEGAPRPAPLDASEARARRGQIAPEAPRRRRTIVAVGVAFALVLAAVAVPVGVRRLHRGLPRIDANAVGLVDASNGHMTQQVALGDIPSGVTAGAGSEWVALASKNEVARVDPVTATVIQTIPVGESPVGIAYGDGAVWVANSNGRSVSRIDPQSNHVVKTIDVGNAPTAIAVTADAVWVTNTLDGTVARIDPTTDKARAFPAGSGPIAIALGAGSLWVANQAGGDVARINPDTGELIDDIVVGQGPSGLAFDGSDVWVANAQSGTVSRIDPATDDETGIARVGGAPSQIGVANERVWVTDPETDRLVAIDPNDVQVATTTLIGNEPFSLAMDGDGIWVTVRGSATSHQGGTLSIESNTPPGTIDPNASYDAHSYTFLSATNDGLLGYAREGGSIGSSLVPDLATTIPRPTNHGRTYTFDLRPGIRYSDGSTVEPSDVRSSFERAYLLNVGPTNYLDDIIGADRCDAHRCQLTRGIIPNDEARTVTFQLRRPDPDFLSVLAMPFLSIVPASTPEHEIRQAPFAAATGPYVISAYTPVHGTAPGSIELDRNPFYQPWSRAAQPPGFPDHIELTFNLDLEQATTDVEHGRANVLLDTPPADRLQEIATSYVSTSHVDTLLGVYYFFLNTTVRPFRVADARRALNIAVDRTIMTRGKLGIGPAGAGGAATCQVLPPNMPGYAPYCPDTRDGTARGEPNMRQARRLVARSGTEGTDITVLTPPLMLPVARYVTSVLDHLKYHAKTRVIISTSTRTYGDYVGDTSNRAQIGWAAWLADTPNASGFVDPTLTCDSIVRNNPDNANTNYAVFCDPSLTAQIDRAGIVGAQSPAHASELWQQIDHEIVDRSPWVPYEVPSSLILVSANVGNYQYNPVLGVLLDQLWVQ
jgi:peptide/nickel transport system substrate-binding protein